MDWSVIDWRIVAAHGVLVFISAVIANLFVVLVGDNRVVAALLAALIARLLNMGRVQVHGTGVDDVHLPAIGAAFLIAEMMDHCSQGRPSAELGPALYPSKQ